MQVGRQGNPAFCELLIAGDDKNLYNETEPTVDQQLFSKYALTPELAKLLGDPVNLQTNRSDLASIFIPDLIKTDLSTGPANLAGSPKTEDRRSPPNRVNAHNFEDNLRTSVFRLPALSYLSLLRVLAGFLT